MAKQNINTQTVLNQFPDAFVVFINLDANGLPIRDIAEATIIPDVADIEHISLTMGSTGKIGGFQLRINNDSNKYFVKDDIEHEIELMNAGQIVVATSKTDDGRTVNVKYDTLPVDLRWGTAEDFLNNRVYNRVRSDLENSTDSPIYLYFQDPSETYDIEALKSIEKDPTIIKALAKGKIKYRVIPSTQLEEFSKSQVISPIKGNDASTVSPEETRKNPSLNVDLSPGSVNDFDLAKILDPIKRTENINLSQSTQTKKDIPVSAKQKDTNVTTFDYTAAVTLDLNEAVKLFQTSEVQSAFFEKYGGQLEHGRCVFEPMQLCAIFMRRRFRDSNDPNDMVLSFVGYVNSVSDAFTSNGIKQELDIIGSDVTKLMHITQANINPSLFTQSLPGSPNFKIWQNRFAELEGWEIIKLLTVGGVFGEDIIYGTGQFKVTAEGKPGATAFTPIFDPTVSTDTLLNTLPFRTIQGEKGAPDKIEKLLFDKRHVHLQTLPFNTEPTDILGDFTVYKRIFGMSFGNWQNEYQTHLQIANMVAAQTNYEFYADGSGDIWYHQPRFHNYHLLVDKQPEVYVLRDEDIINANFTESDENVLTSAYLTGQPNFYDGPKEIAFMTGFYENPALVMKYGRRMVSYSHPYVVNAGDLNYFARSYLQRVNAGRFVGKVTLIGRPEIRMHMPVYVPYRNLVFYITGIQHTLTMGNTFQTTLTLKYGRKPWEILPEIFDYSSKARPSLVTEKRYDFVKTLEERLAAKAEEQSTDATTSRPSTTESIDKFKDIDFSVDYQNFNPNKPDATKVPTDVDGNPLPSKTFIQKPNDGDE